MPALVVLPFNLKTEDVVRTFRFTGKRKREKENSFIEKSSCGITEHPLSDSSFLCLIVFLVFCSVVLYPLISDKISYRLHPAGIL